MTNSRQLAIEAVRGFKAGLQTRLDSWPAFTGDGRGNLRNSDSDSQYMLARWPLATSPAVEVLNDFIPDVENLRVMVGYTADQPDVLRILSRADSRADNVPFVGVMNHASQHGYLAPDMDWVDFRRVLSFRVIPYSGLNVFIYGGVLPVGGSFVNVANQVIDLTASVPVSGARYSAISVATDGTITVTDGSTQPTAQALTVANVPTVPSGEFRLAAVLLRAGQTSITETLAQNDLLDLRWPQAHLESSISPSSVALTNAHIIVGNASNVGADVAMSGDATIANTGVITLGSVNSNVGSFTNASITVNAKGLITAASSGATPVTGSGTTNYVAKFTGSNAIGDSLIRDDGTTIGINTAPISTSLVQTTATPTITSGTFNGQTVTLTGNPGGSSSGVFQGLSFVAATQAANAQNFTGSVRGVVGQAQHNGTGTVTTLTGIDAVTQINSSGNVTTAYGIRLTSVAGSTGRANSNYGLYIENTAPFTTINTAIGIAATSGAGSLKYGLSIGAITGGTGANVAIETLGGQLQFTHNANSTLATFTGHSTFTAATPLMLLTRNDANTNVVVTNLTLRANTTGTAAAGFGVKQNYELESSTTASQTAGYDERLWTDATHASRTVLYRGTTTGNATQSGFYGAWAFNAVSNTAITIIPNGTGDVASVGTFLFSVKDNTSATTNGGVVVLNPGGGAISLLSDGTDTVQITCAADGSVTIARSAGTHTFSFSCYGTWQ